MAWYDRFALVYDASLERLYADSRGAAIGTLGLQPGQTVIDLACGTGQNFPGLVAAVGPEGRVRGIDRSAGMLAEARRRIEREAYVGVDVEQADVREVDLSGADALFCALGFSTFPEWESVLDKVCASLPAGATVGLFDVRATSWNPQTTMVEWMAQADLSRDLAGALEARTEGYQHHWLPGSPWTFGGRLFVATGRVRNSGVEARTQ